MVTGPAPALETRAEPHLLMRMRAASREMGNHWSGVGQRGVDYMSEFLRF
jgi:hypothetical protein